MSSHLPTYQTESENEQLLLSEQTVSTEHGYFNTRVGVAGMIVGMMIATVAIRTQLFPSASNSPIMKSGAPIMKNYAPDDFSIDSPRAPITLSTFAKKSGVVRAFFDKYGLNTQPMSPEDKMLKAIMTEANKHPVAPRTQPTKEGIKGDPSYWVIASQYTGPACKGTVDSVMAFAGATCIPVSMVDGSMAFSMVCSSRYEYSHSQLLEILLLLPYLGHILMYNIFILIRNSSNPYHTQTTATTWCWTCTRIKIAPGLSWPRPSWAPPTTAHKVLWLPTPPSPPPPSWLVAHLLSPVTTTHTPYYILSILFDTHVNLSTPSFLTLIHYYLYHPLLQVTTSNHFMPCLVPVLAPPNTMMTLHKIGEWWITAPSHQLATFLHVHTLWKHYKNKYTLWYSLLSLTISHRLVPSHLFHHPHCSH